MCGRVKEFVWNSFQDQLHVHNISDSGTIQNEDECGWHIALQVTPSDSELPSKYSDMYFELERVMFITKHTPLLLKAEHRCTVD